MSEENYKFNIPEELYGTIIDGIDLQILSSDSVRLIEAYAQQEGELSEIQEKVLRQCDRELQIVIPKTQGKLHVYFKQLLRGISDVIKKLEHT